MKTNEELPLRATVENGRLSVSIGNGTLAFAFENGEENNPYSDDFCDTVREFSVSDPAQFAKDVCAEMNREGEDGSTPLTRFLDQMMNEAVEQGSLGIHDPEDEEEPAPMAERTAEDVKLRPIPGDVLKGKFEGNGSPCRRSVVGVTPLGNVFYRIRGWGSHELICGSDAWREWARTAEVIHIAQPKEKTDGE